MSDGGKGSASRPFVVDHDTFSANWETIFGKKPRQVIEDEIAEDEAFNAIDKLSKPNDETPVP